MQSPASADIPEEPQGAEPPSRRYNTRVGPRPPPLLCIHGLHGGHRLLSWPEQLARGSLHVLSLSLHGLQLPRVLHSHHLSYPLLRGLGVHYPIPGNVDCRAKDFHGESYYDIPALAVDPRFRDSMLFFHMYSLLPFMTPRQFFYPRVVLEFYHTMTSRGVSNPMQLHFNIDGCPRLL